MGNLGMVWRPPSRKKMNALMPHKVAGTHLVNGLGYMAMPDDAIDLRQVLEAADQSLIVSLGLLLTGQQLAERSACISL